MRQNGMIIGIGNTLRRDDGVGPLLAERLAALLVARGMPVQWLATQQLTPDLAEVIAEAAPVALCFVDAAAGGAAVTITPVVCSVDAATTGSHTLGPSLLLYLARQLYGWSGPAWLVQAPASDFAHGEGFSPTTQQVLDQAGALADQLNTLMATG